MNLKFDDRGLVPAIVQSAGDGSVLMLGWMNREAIAHSRETGRVTFYSRSRQAQWEKGETSGNWLELVDMRPDCDADALLVTAVPHGPTCHTGRPSCFDREPGGPPSERSGDAARLGTVLAELAEVVRRRDEERPEGSYTAQLLAAGRARVAQKVGEEALEVALAAARSDSEPSGGDRTDATPVLEESADLLYHLVVLWRAVGVDADAIAEVLAARAG